MADNPELARPQGCGVVPPGPAGASQPFPTAERAAAIAVTWFIGAVTLLFAGTALYFSFHEGTWHDEAWSMTTARGSFWRTIRQAFQAEGQPPLYFVMLNAWLRIHRSIAFARLLSLLSTLGGGLMFARVLRVACPTAPRWVSGFAVLYVFASPFGMYLATEARGYGLQLLIGATLAWIAARALSRGCATVAESWALVGLGVAAAYTHYLAILAPVVVTVTLVGFGALPRRRAAWIVAGGAMCAIPLAVLAPGCLQVQSGSRHGHFLDGIPMLLRSLSFTLAPQPSARDARLAVAYLLVVAITAAVFLRSRRRRGHLPRQFLAFATASGIALALLVLAALLLGKGAVSARYLTCMMPILWIAALLFMGHALGWAPTVALLIPFCLVGGYRSFVTHSSGIRNGDWRRIAQTIEATSDGPNTVLVFPPVEVLAARIELGDGYRVFGIPRDFNGEVAATLETYWMPEPEVLRSSLAARVGSQPFWFAYQTPVFGEPAVQHSLEPLQSFLRRMYLPVRKLSYQRPSNAPLGTTHLELYQLIPAERAQL